MAAAVAVNVGAVPPAKSKSVPKLKVLLPEPSCVTVIAPD